MLSLKLNDTSLYNQSVFDYTNLSLNAIDSARLNKVEGSYLMINGKYEESIRLFISALKTFTNHERMYEIIELHNLIGANYAQAKFFDEGLTYFRTGLTVAKKMKIELKKKNQLKKKKSAKKKKINKKKTKLRKKKKN